MNASAKLHFVKCFSLALVALSIVRSSGAATPDVAPDYESSTYAVGFSRTAPVFTLFCVDSLGRGVVHDQLMEPPQLTNGLEFKKASATKFEYIDGSQPKQKPAWEISCDKTSFVLRSRFTGDSNAAPFVLRFNQRLNHATLLGLMNPQERKTSLPCVLHLPDRGSCRITSKSADLKLDYDARRYSKPPFIEIKFPAATGEHATVEYKLEMAAIYPKAKGIDEDPLFDGFRRDFINIFQVNPRIQMLANNSSSDACSFTVYFYAEMAKAATPLVKNLTCLDIIRMTLDRYLNGGTGYGQIGYGKKSQGADLIAWPTPWTTSDTAPSLLIAACDYVEGSKDLAWAKKNYRALSAWGHQMFETDKDGNGLIEYPSTGNSGDRPKVTKRPSNWWDTVGFGHEDAYANALAYHAGILMAGLAKRVGDEKDAAYFTERAAKLRAAYVPAFLNPQTGVLAGWKSEDGKLHDYWFTFVNGAAITYGLVDEPAANKIMDNMLRKMQEAGYTNFNLGLPGNLAPVRKEDYINENRSVESARSIGQPQLDDGSDAFQYYENGGATACFSYFTIKALYTLKRYDDARKIFYPMLRGYAVGDFQGFQPSGASKDWRDWSGVGHGYEGILVDGYLPLLCVFDELRAREELSKSSAKAK